MKNTAAGFGKEDDVDDSIGMLPAIANLSRKYRISEEECQLDNDDNFKKIDAHFPYLTLLRKQLNAEANNVMQL